MKLWAFIRASFKHTKRWHLICFTIALVVVADIAYQAYYPQDRAPYSARVFGRSVGGYSYDTIVADLQKQLLDEKVVFKVDDIEVAVLLRELGVEYYIDDMAQNAITYPIEMRWVPTSIWWYHSPVNERLVRISDDVFAKKAGLIAKQFSRSVKNAGIAFEGEKLKITKSQDGREVTVDMLRTRLNEVLQKEMGVIAITPKILKPTVSNAKIADIEMQAKRMLGKRVVFSGDETEKYTPSKQDRAKWFAIDKDKQGAPVLRIDTAKIKEYMSRIQTAEYQAPTSARIRIIDGIQQKREEGEVGSTIDIDAASNAVKKGLMSDRESIDVNMERVRIAPKTQYTREYTSSEAGLRAYVDYTSKNEGVWISFAQIDASGWTADGRAWQSIPSASTYKLYVAMRLAEEIEAGNLSYDTPMLDTDVGGCLERMIVPSTNRCAVHWIGQFGGRTGMTNYVHSKGFSNGTGFTFSDATHTTAGDLRRILIGIDNGTLVRGEHRATLLEKMGRQNYRYGIPAGTNAYVQDKVGFLWDYVHDAAIVHHPRGKYVLVVMTKGYGNYAKIKEITREIEGIVYP